jgi:hypothetical protein
LGPLAAIIGAIASSDLIGQFAPVFRMMLPALLIVPMFIFYGGFFDRQYGLPWLMYAGARIILAAISSIASNVDQLRSLVFALCCFVPFAFAGFSLKSNHCSGLFVIRRLVP